MPRKGVHGERAALYGHGDREYQSPRLPRRPLPHGAKSKRLTHRFERRSGKAQERGKP